MQRVTSSLVLLLFAGLMCARAFAQNLPEETRKHLLHDLAVRSLSTASGRTPVVHKGGSY